jgi:ferric-dicitrate binding protein FerR (iron transport regulator)
VTTPDRRRPPALDEALRTHAEGESLAELWDALGAVAPTGAGTAPTEQEAAWSRIAARTGLAAAAPTAERGGPLRVVRGAGVRSDARRPAVVRRWAWPIAAALALAVGLAAGWPRTVAWQVAAGRQRTVTLPDGSTAQLNADSRLRWQGGWFGRGVRQARLEGEAFFAVVPDGRAFEVVTADATVRVLGTRFGVRAREGERGTDVVVEEGRVRVGATRGAAVVLTAGMRAAVRGARIEPGGDVPSVARELAWRTGGLALVAQPLPAVLREAARRFDVEIDVRIGTTPDDRLTLYYPQLPPLERLLDDLCQTRGCRWTRSSRGVRVLPAAQPAPPMARRATE